MKHYKSLNQQLKILRPRGLVILTNGFFNYYNVINGCKDLFLEKGADDIPLVPEKYLLNTHSNELQSLFLFDRTPRILFLKYILIFENSFKTVLSHEFPENIQNQIHIWKYKITTIIVQKKYYNKYPS